MPSGIQNCISFGANSVVSLPGSMGEMQLSHLPGVRRWKGQASLLLFLSMLEKRKLLTAPDTKYLLGIMM